MRKLRGGMQPSYVYGGDRISAFAVGLSIALIVLSGPKLFATLLQGHVIGELKRQIPVPKEMLSLVDTLQEVASLAILAVGIVFFVVFLFWLKKRYENLGTFSHNTSYSSGWAIGGFFVPFLNLVRPFQITKEVLEFSDCKKNPKTRSDTILVTAWWALFWIDSILGNLVARSAPKAGDGIEVFVNYSLSLGISDFLECLLYPCCLLLILKVNAKQSRAIEERRRSQLENAPVEAANQVEEALDLPPKKREE